MTTSSRGHMTDKTSETKTNRGCPACALHKLYRFIEPQILYYLTQNRLAYGYQLLVELKKNPLTDGKIDHAAIYRTLRALEYHGNVVSEWDTEASGPAKRQYRITDNGRYHLQEWVDTMEKMQVGLMHFVAGANTKAFK